MTDKVRMENIIISKDALKQHDDKVRAELIEELRNRHLDDNSWCEYTVDTIADELEEIAQKLKRNPSNDCCATVIFGMGVQENINKNSK